MKYYIAYIKVNEGNRVPTLSETLLNKGDLVKVEGKNGEYEVTEVTTYTDSTIPYDIQKLNKVISLKPVSGIRISAEMKSYFSYGDYHTDSLMRVKDKSEKTSLSFLSDLRIINDTDKEYKNLRIEFSFSSPAFSVTPLSIGDIGAYTEEPVSLPFIHVMVSDLEKLTEMTTESVDISLKDDENVYATYHHIYNLLPVSMPSVEARYDFRLYLKYIEPNDSKVIEFAQKATMYNDNKEIIAYQNKNINAILKELNAIYLAIHDSGIVYQNPPAGGLFEADSNIYSQRIRLNGEVLSQHVGTCLDLALTYCAVLENLGYNPVFIINKTHAFLGVYLKDKNNITKDIFEEGTITSPSVLYNYVTGTGEMVLIDATMATSLSDISFEECTKDALNLIYGYNELFFAYDVEFLHRGVFSPIPNTNEEFEAIIEPYEIDDKVSKVKEVKYIEVKKQEEKDRFTFWEKKLLDLSEGNPLVNFNIKASNTIRLTGNFDLDDEIAKSDAIRIDAPVKGELDMEAVLSSGIRPKELFDVSEDDKVYALGDEKTLKSLISKSRSATEETGAPTLYLVMGILKYRRLNKSEGNAPFMVLPVKVSKNKNKSGYTINYDYDDVMVNQTFFEYYSENNPDVDFSSLYGVSSTERYKDICHTFKLMNNEEIILDSDMFFLANLTFSHYIMWLDMKKRKEELKKNKIVESIIENRNMIEEVPALEYEDKERYESFAAPLPYDSTQLEAILDAGNGKSFILDGPPGTGKSQTIVNMIVNAFYNGKTVLFVAEKKAALDVVYDRLRKLKLDRFALELHSNKANKADFFAKLKDSMEIGRTVDPSEFEETCQSLELKKSELLSVINKMHNKKYFMSLYDAITETEYNEKDSLELDVKYLTEYTKEKDKEISDLLDSYKTLAGEIPSFSDTPLKKIGITDVKFFKKDEIKQEFAAFASSFDDLYYDVEKLIQKAGINAELNPEIITIIFYGLKLAFHKKLYTNTLPKYFMEYDKDQVNAVFDVAKKNAALVKNAVIDYQAASALDTESRISALKNTEGFFKKISLHSKCKKELKPYISSKVKTKDLLGYYQNIRSYQENMAYIRKNDEILNALAETDMTISYMDYENIQDTYNNTVKMKEIIDKLAILELDDLVSVFTAIANGNNPDLGKMYEDTLKELKDYEEKEKALAEKYAIRYSLIPDKEAYIEFLNYMASDMEMADLITMAKINGVTNKLEESGLKLITNAVNDNSLMLADLSEVYRKSLAEGFIRIYFMDDDINYFNSSLFDAEIEKYRGYIRDYSNYSVAEVSARLSKKLIHDSVQYMDSSPIGRLKKSIQSSGRGTTIRKTLSEFDSIIKSYFPVFLMSPLSAAQYLSVNSDGEKGVSKFDMVIFDEASQIPTHEAIGPIARGNSLIVAGDPMQMPPSAYFQTGISLSDDDMIYEDADSLLNECLAIDLPRHRLKFHYRSHHESLIEFSNQTFYNSSLYTFPSVDSLDFRVSFSYVPLKEEKKSSSMSKEESDAILNTVREIYANPENHGKSLGIIVFNITQQEVLEDRFVKYLSANTELKEELAYAETKTGEDYFIKSLENVQGDERDIIILSVGFRKNAMGRPFVNGPLVRVNGEKRLNVAVSRSKEAMYIISTVKYSDFEADERLTSLGAKSLKNFLGYAEYQSMKSSQPKEAYNDKLALLIKNDLEKRGISSDCGVGTGMVKVDLAIKKPDSDEFVLGILIDNSVSLEDLSLRDRLYVNEFVLNNLRWKVVNVYSVEYFKNKQAVIDKIIKAIDDPYVKENITVNPEIIQEEKVDLSVKAEDYMDAVLVRSKYDKETGFKNLNINLRAIVETEYPVSFNRVKSIIRESYGLKSISQKMSDTIAETLSSLRYNYTVEENGEKFYWSNDNIYMSGFRYAHGRDIDDVSREEICACMREIMKLQGSLSSDDLYKAVLIAFDFDSKILNKRVRERLDYVYNYGLSERLID